MTCDQCNAAREAPEHAQFNQGCIWCGARYFQSLKSLPPPRTMDDGNGNTKPETKEERQAWRADVLKSWAKYGHDVERMKELAAAPAVPIEPAKRRARSG